jgi:hypothetical protein
VVYYEGKSYEVDGKLTVDSDIAAKKIFDYLYEASDFYADGYREFYILRGEKSTIMIPVKLCSVLPPTKTIKLTNDYDAVIHKDYVKVGCQEIPISKVKEILEEHAKLPR